MRQKPMVCLNSVAVRRTVLLCSSSTRLLGSSCAGVHGGQVLASAARDDPFPKKSGVTGPENLHAAVVGLGARPVALPFEHDLKRGHRYDAGLDDALDGALVRL